MKIMFYLFVLATLIFSQPDSGNIIHSGQATYYAATGAGSCMFDPSPNDLMVAAMNNEEYDNASVCGASIRVKGRLGEVTVRIVDLCPECPYGNIDLSKQAFAKIDDTIKGRVPVTWWYVESLVEGPVKYRIKTGSNPWWIGIQVLNHRTPISKLEAYYNGAWVTIPRTNYNYFVYSAGLGAGPFTLRVTDFYGEQLIDANIPLKPDSIILGHANFSSHSQAIFHTRNIINQPKFKTTYLIKLGNNIFTNKNLNCDNLKIYDIKGNFINCIYNNKINIKAGNGIFIIKK
jgi:expansin (peptidoglycan-binding protein)